MKGRSRHQWNRRNAVSDSKLITRITAPRSSSRGFWSRNCVMCSRHGTHPSQRRNTSSTGRPRNDRKETVLPSRSKSSCSSMPCTPQPPSTDSRPTPSECQMPPGFGGKLAYRELHSGHAMKIDKGVHRSTSHGLQSAAGPIEVGFGSCFSTEVGDLTVWERWKREYGEI